MSFEGVRPDENYTTRGKTIRQLIHELKSFENQELEVRMSLDGGITHHPVSILSRIVDEMNGNDHICVLEYIGED